MTDIDFLENCSSKLRLNDGLSRDFASQGMVVIQNSITNDGLLLEGKAAFFR